MTPGTYSEFFASHYDEIYRDKQYDAEVEYVDTLLRDYCDEPSDVLDIGCGTGTHGILLAERGYSVLGIDSSGEMVSQAEAKIAEADTENIAVEVGTIQDLDVDREFDAVLAQFGVIGYVNENADLIASFEAVRDHLVDDGVFVFDTWYGPTVLAERPEDRVKRIEVDGGTILRHAEPTLHHDKNVVDVRYTFYLISDEREPSTMTEVHRIRYFFEPEIELFCELGGLKLVDSHPYRELGDDLRADDWNATWVAKPGR